MKWIRGVGALALVLCLALIACTPSSDRAEAVAMGRYVEQALPLPAAIVSLHYLGMLPQGDFLALGLDEGQEHLKVWRSSDGGESWREDAPDWLDTLREYDVASFTLDEAGTPWFTYEAEDPERDRVYAGDDPDAIAAFVARPNPLVALGGGVPRELGATIQSDSGNQANHLQVRDNLAASNCGGVALYDLDSGRRRFEVLPEDYIQSGEYLLGEALAVVDGGMLRLYDTADGRQTAELALETGAFVDYKSDFFDFQSATTVLGATGEKGVYAYCNSGGVYRVSADGLIHERVVDGERTALIQPTTSIRQLFVRGEDYYVYITDRDSMPWQLSGATLLRYRYDDTVPAFPTAELRVRALNDSPTARQAAAVFQREHPDVQVRVEVALDAGSAVTAEDALRTLSVELLAGQGPDVLILDGMPVQSYIEKGALLDLNGLLPDQLQDQLLPNLRGVYASGNSLWAIPTRFTVPMLLADSGEMDNLSSLEAVSARIAALDSPQIGLLPEDLSALLYLLFGGQWLGEDGSVDEAALTEGLRHMGAIAARYDGVDHNGLWDSRGDARVGAIGWIDGWTPFFLGELAAVEHVAGPYTAVRDHGAAYGPYPGGGAARVWPRGVAGVNGASAQGELAVEFVSCMLSEAVQPLKLGDGLSVRHGTLRAGEAAGLSGAGRFGVSFHDEFDGGREKGLTIAMAWPDEAFFVALWSQVEALDAEPLPDAAMWNIFQQETAPFFEGQRALDDTVDALKTKLGILRSEQYSQTK